MPLITLYEWLVACESEGKRKGQVCMCACEIEKEERCNCMRERNVKYINVYVRERKGKV